MSATTALGWFASLLAISMFLPQLIRTYRVGFEGSIGTIVLGSTNGAAWVLYGILRGDPVIVVCNLLLGSCAFAILVRWALDRRTAARQVALLEDALEVEDVAA
ncbi:MAG: hypothetical protein ACTHOG_06705 [Marmoricola sp.]